MVYSIFFSKKKSNRIFFWGWISKKSFWELNLHSVLLLEFQVLLPEGVDTINHGLDELNLRVSQTMLVGNVIGVTSLATRFSTGSTGLEAENLAPGLQGINGVLGPAGQVNVDGGAHASAQVGGARVDESKLGGQQEFPLALSLDGITDGLDTPSETLKDTLDVTALLHGNDAELILLVDPDQEGLLLVVEDTATLGPVTLHTSDLQVGVTRHEEEMVVDELLTSLVVHASQGVVGTGQVSGQGWEGILHQSLNVHTLLLGDSGGKTESLDVATNTDPGRVNGHISLNVALDLVGIHVRGVLKVSREAMVLADEGIEDLSEINIGVLITSIHTTMLVVELNSAGNGLGQSELGGLGDDSSQLVPPLLGDMGGDQGVLRLDIREGGHGFCCL
jgi:hypothetical protein